MATQQKPITRPAEPGAHTTRAAERAGGRGERPGKGKPGTMPENPASVDHAHEPAGLKPGENRLKRR